jgi:hypothetical protein
MQAYPNIISWLDHLRLLMPCNGFFHVGAGSGVDAWTQYLIDRAYPSGTLVEADKNQFKHLRSTTCQQSGWRLCEQLIAPSANSTIFYQSNYPSESGLLKPESLQDLWPNLTTCHQQAFQAITLKQLVQSSEPSANWLLLNCFPALPILEAAGDALEGIEVIVARILLYKSPEVHGNASLTSLQPFLEERHFRFLTLETGRHPNIGHALFVRDPQSIEKNKHIKQLKAELANLEIRTKLQNEEVRKIENQIAFLKEMLLKDITT